MTLSLKKMASKAGYLELILGPMFSGKTSKLLELHKQYTFCNIPITVINYAGDTRYHNTMMSNHDNIMIPCIQTTKLIEIQNDIKSADVVLINEGQFFEDLVSSVEIMLKDKKIVYICGLDGDFERKKFGGMIDLIPLCDKVTKLNSMCNLCKDGSPGIFSLRLTEEKEQLVIGSTNYIPVCRHCYNIHSKE